MPYALRSSLSLFVVFLLTGLLAGSAAAQKQDLTLQDYAQWQSISTAEFSPDGSWFAWNINVVEGDGWLMLQQAGEDPDDAHKFDHAAQPTFSKDNRWFAFRIGVSEEEERRIEEQNGDVKYRLGLMELASAEVDTFENISGFAFSDDGRFLVMDKYPDEESKIRGSDIILRDLEAESNQLIGNVAEYGFNEDGTLFAYLIDAQEELGNGVHLIDLETRSTRVLESDEAEYRMLTWNEDGDGLAFLKAFEDEGYEEKAYHVLAFNNLGSNPQSHAFDPAAQQGFPEDFRLVDFRRLQWSDDGDRLFFGIKEWTRKEEEAEDEGENEEEEEGEDEADPDAHLDPTNVEVWHWQDDPVVARQRVMRNQLQQSNLLSVWHLGEDRFVQLVDDHEQSVTLTGDQQHAVVYDPTPYQPRMREGWNDIYVVDVSTGERTPMLERQEFVSPSPDGGYLAYFRDDHWWSYDIANDRHVNLTEDIEEPFYNYTRITGRESYPAFGSGQWAENDEWVLLYDEFDVYRAAPAGSSIERITDGRADQIRYRQQRLDWEEDALDPSEPLYLTMYGEKSKDRGYARYQPDGRVETLIYEPAQISRLTLADDAPVFAYMRQTAVDSPNFFRVGEDFSNPVALTNTNPQQDDYHWGRDELITYTNERGEELQGRLLYPANYEEGEQYPMIVYIYELRSQTLHNYSMPTRTSAYNQRRYSSEGFFVFEPDITYELHRPGLSAVESVVPAVEAVLETGIVDPDRIGLTGHSWGGYQTNFIVTQTDLFSSAVAGAPLVNMVSMYNSIYWNSGNTNASIFEVSQGRLPQPWWEDWDNFIENSPIHHMTNTETPLLLMFGVDDGAVDFNQGVELYTTMRRMQKEFAMLVYDGENHSLRRRENQIDYATRAFEWHAHHLLGEEPADWIVEGLPYIERPEILEQEQQGSR